MRIWNKSTPAKLALNGVPGLLVMVSDVIFDGIFFGKPQILDFHLFLYQVMWTYLSVSESLFRIPPLESVYYLDVNSELYQEQISNLNKLHKEHGLIVWAPAILHVEWSADEFFRCICQYQHFKNVFNDANPQFLTYLQVQFILKLLEHNKYDLGGITSHDFIQITQESVHYLWTHRLWNTLDEVLLALYENKGLQLLNDDYFLIQLCGSSNITESFIGIMIELFDYKGNLEYPVCNHLAKSVFFWFMDGDRQRAMDEIAILSNHDLLDAVTLDTLICFASESSLFYFVANESKKEFIDAVFMRYSVLGDIDI